LFVVSNNQRYLRETEAKIRQKSATVEMIIVAGSTRLQRQTVECTNSSVLAWRCVLEALCRRCNS